MCDPPGERVASYTCRQRRASGVCPAPASARVDAVDALVLPELDARAESVDLEAALNEFFDAQVAYAAADRELEDFLAASLITPAWTRGLYGREVARRREALREATAAYRQELDAQDAMASPNQDALASTPLGPLRPKPKPSIDELPLE